MTLTDSPTTLRPTRHLGLVAGIGLLAMAVLAAVAVFGILERLVTTGDPATTARDVLAAEGSFRLAVAMLVLVVVLDLVVAWALMEFFAPVHHGLSTLAAWFRIVYAGVFLVAIAQLNQPGTEVLAHIDSFNTIWDVGLTLFGAHLLLIGYLTYLAGNVPTALGVLLAIAGLGYLVDGFGSVLVADYSADIGAFTFVGEVLLMLWLLVKGRNVQAQRR